ncbi:stage III sporulation protein AG [Ectobacillus ponti]|uniref:Stage III sporulation protein AG n=1 Tax=Ectobacillus ponti TaxID=2961894 RepID=A0AA41X561_9BACI|nr:stage III sporulation protein AG [Ectobacillus ponti]MCP8967055.1 stage III sporulation protein AG [Ectobacillus ponti]
MNEKKPSFLSKFLKGSEEDERTRKKLAPKVMVGLLAAGILLMFSGNLFQAKKEVPVFNNQTAGSKPEDVPAFASKNSTSSSIGKAEKELEDELQSLLESIKGVGSVTVYVNLDSTNIKVLNKDRTTRTQTTTEKDPQGGNRQIQDETQDEKTTIIRSDNSEGPIVIKEDKPPVRGVAVTAEGAGDLEVKKEIIEMVTRFLGVESHKVAVNVKK